MRLNDFASARAAIAAQGGWLSLPRAEAPEGLEALGEAIKAYHGETKANATKLINIEAALNEQAKVMARMELSGGGGGPGGATPAAVRAAYANLHDFMRGRVRAEMSVTVDPEGGYTTQPELDSRIGQYLESQNPMRRLARVVQTTAAEFSMPFNSSQAASGWVAEKAARPATASNTFSLITVTPHELYAMPKSTQALLDDSAFDMEAFINEEILKEFARKEGDAFINGNGIGKPRGWLDYSPEAVTTDDATRAFGKLQYVVTGASGALVGMDALRTIVYKLHSGYRANASWIMNSETTGVVSKLKDGDGKYLWQDSVIAGQPPLLMGYPVATCENMPNISANSFSIAFGDFRSGYIIVDRTGVRLLRDPYTDKPYINFYTTKRVGGSLVDSLAIKLLKFGTS